MLVYQEVAIVERIPSVADQIKAVIAHWQKQHPQSFPRIHGDLPEWKKIRDRLTKDGYTVAQLCRAIDGIHASPFHLGENDRGKKYLSLELVVRDGKHVQQFLEIAAQQDAPVLSEKTMKTLRAGQSWANKRGAND